MDTVTIEWTNPIRYDRLSRSRENALGYSGFYMIIAGVLDVYLESYINYELLYIGQAYRQNIIKRVQQEHQSDECINEFLDNNSEYILFVKAGSIVDSSLERDSQRFFNDIECCLIYNNYPSCNIKCKESYNGRELKIENVGDFIPLKKRSTCF